ncbi:MAG TPA: ABC transporter ATP-binding protein [Burkholderiales bacterium]|nr:ABC transporter ATP-binding protein [Burkholderiales bacterium]
MSVEARLRVRRGELDLDVELAIARGELVALLGPNGAGKTTIVHALAGLVALDAGSLRIDGVTLDDPAAGVFVPPEERPVAVAFQDLLLFPHLSAVANVAFGLRARGVARAAADRAAREWLERFGIAALAERKPRELSGGEAQRVALARALALGPALLLLDEPFSALDAEARGRLRRDLRAHLARQPGMRLLVTHDPVEAIALADRLVVLESGRVTHSGTAADIAARPRSPYAAALAGVNLFRGRARDRRVEISGGGTLVVAEPCDGDVLLVVHPRAVALYRDPPAGTPRNCWRATVAGVDPEGERGRVWLAGPPAIVAEVTAEAIADLGIEPGRALWVAVKATEIAAFPA